VKSDFEGFVYLNFHYPPVTWNVARGVFHSIDCLDPKERGSAISMSMASMLSNSSAERLTAEFHLENIRQLHYPEQVSRLRGLFVFDEIESMGSLWENNNWGGHFIDDYITDIGVSVKNSSRVDSNWITDIINKNGELQPNWLCLAHKYWSGDAHPVRAPVWERIVEGAVTVWSMDAKNEALQEITAMWNNSLGLLSHSCNCASFGSIDGEVFPVWKRTDTGISIVYSMRLVDSKSSEFLSELEIFIRENPERCTNLGLGDHVPDLSGYFVDLVANDSDKLGKLITQLTEASEPVITPVLQ